MDRIDTNAQITRYNKIFF